jgi:hypothetical protein
MSEEEKPKEKQTEVEKIKNWLDVDAKRVLIFDLSPPIKGLPTEEEKLVFAEVIKQADDFLETLRIARGEIRGNLYSNTRAILPILAMASSCAEAIEELQEEIDREDNSFVFNRPMAEILADTRSLGEALNDLAEGIAKDTAQILEDDKAGKIPELK